ncbi:MAG TPA: hypothetical protein VHP33_37560 [Polyangiaceae bacterium]|nr:hypothetical protein [Polyangiaceae bacterium]
MEKKRKPAGTPAQQATVHPETQPQAKPRVPGESSSNRGASDRQQDGRTGHDKDANEQQARTNKGKG